MRTINWGWTVTPNDLVRLDIPGVGFLHLEPSEAHQVDVFLTGPDSDIPGTLMIGNTRLPDDTLLRVWLERVGEGAYYCRPVIYAGSHRTGVYGNTTDVDPGAIGLMFAVTTFAPA